MKVYRHSDAEEPIATVDAETLNDGLDRWLNCRHALASQLLFVDDQSVVFDTDGRAIVEHDGGRVSLYVCYHPIPSMAARYGRKSIIESYKGDDTETDDFDSNDATIDELCAVVTQWLEGAGVEIRRCPQCERVTLDPQPLGTCSTCGRRWAKEKHFGGAGWGEPQAAMTLLRCLPPGFAVQKESGDLYVCGPHPYEVVEDYGTGGTPKEAIVRAAAQCAVEGDEPRLDALEDTDE